MISKSGHSSKHIDIINKKGEAYAMMLNNINWL